MSGPAGAEREHPLYRYNEELTPEDLEQTRRVLPEHVTEAHLRWLETGEGDPWGELSG